MQQVPYSQFAGFEYVYLEDSYVLNIEIELNTVEFLLLVVLTEKHADFGPPNHQQQCYQRGLLRFSNVRRVHGLLESAQASTDASGNVDYGNIDQFYLMEEQYHLSGDWGRLTIRSTAPSLDIEKASFPNVT